MDFFLGGEDEDDEDEDEDDGAGVCFFCNKNDSFIAFLFL
jgi:hypothetical protein